MQPKEVLLVDLLIRRFNERGAECRLKLYQEETQMLEDIKDLVKGLIPKESLTMAVRLSFLRCFRLNYINRYFSDSLLYFQ